MSLVPSVMSFPFEWNGETLTLKPPTIASRTMFSDFLGRRAISEVVRMKDAYGLAFETALNAARLEARDGFAWGAPAFIRELQADRNLQELATILFQQNGHQITLDAVKKMWETPTGEKVKAGTDEVGGDVFRPEFMADKLVQAMIELISRPNSPGPAATAPGQDQQTTK